MQNTLPHATQPMSHEEEDACMPHATHPRTCKTPYHMKNTLLHAEGAANPSCMYTNESTPLLPRAGLLLLLQPLASASAMEVDSSSCFSRRLLFPPPPLSLLHILPLRLSSSTSPPPPPLDQQAQCRAATRTHANSHFFFLSGRQEGRALLPNES
jgi:hypothetical protein